MNLTISEPCSENEMEIVISNNNLQLSSFRTLGDAASLTPAISEPDSEVFPDIVSDITRETTMEISTSNPTSPFSLFCTLGDDSPIDVIWYTPFARSAHWYSSQGDWMALNHLVTSSSEAHHLNSQLFQTFFQRGKDFDTKLAIDLSKEHDFTIARAAFKENHGTTRNPYDAEVVHAFMQILLMDRLLYFKNRHNRASALFSSPISTSMGSFSQPDNSTAVFATMCETWLNNIESFVNIWQSQRPSTTPADSIRSRTVVSSLAEGLTRSQGQSRLAKVEGNFCLAALGLKALLMVSGFVLLNLL